ncbi:DEAD/DEAH box helicase family protein [Aminobacter sp. AP02]|uniref:DEAD/DEAH box helicase n=1 Tax=Aminobacter sp. AP02 TaxID=2135737 RepID=UPI000D6B62FF|nr:DEAD/DEAH box helicase family protein [Aminobacter sp. AP02]PWK76306.1 type III restriction enzyme [Aminobacter sp. AP02]
MSERNVEAIAERMRLRAPQRQALAILARLTKLLPLRHISAGVASDLRDAQAAVQACYPAFAGFDRNFPSFCFALATGVGKTQLMGASIAYLQSLHRFRNFLIVAPNVTIYEKLITDFAPTSPEYVLKAVPDFVVSPPRVITAENLGQEIRRGSGLLTPAIYIFTIAKLNADFRGGRYSKTTRFREEIGESPYDYLSGLKDLVLLMDEAHCYRGAEGARTLNALQPMLGLELTATPFTGKAPSRRPFKNVVYDYPFAQAMVDGFVKEPSVVTRENFKAANMSPEECERLKLDDAILVHENTKSELVTFARQTGRELIKPIILVLARDTSHAASLMRLIASQAFCDGRYAGKVIQVDSSFREEETIKRLLEVERTDEPTEIVIHVNMLGIGWDVRNLYTIVPLRAGHSWTLVVQAVGRGSRLPYGKRTGVAAIDRLNIVAHDRFQEFVDEARRPGSPFQLREVVVADGAFTPGPATVVCEPNLIAGLGLGEGEAAERIRVRFSDAERPYLQLILRAIGELEVELDTVACIQDLNHPSVRLILRDKVRRMRPLQEHCQLDLEGLIERVVGDVVEHSIGIPRIVPTDRQQAAFSYQHFKLDVSVLPNDVPSEALWLAHLRTGTVERIGMPPVMHMKTGSAKDDLVDLLAELDCVAYDLHADLLYDLAGQYVRHLRTRLSEDELRGLLNLRGGEIARAIQGQMQQHRRECETPSVNLQITRAFTALRAVSFTAAAGEAPVDYRSPPDKTNIARLYFTGFSRCLYRFQKFDSDAERRMAVIVDRDANKWMRPAWNQLQLVYRLGANEAQYVPDFVAETDAQLLIIEIKATRSMDDADVRAKRDAAVAWCAFASDHAQQHGGKPWRYVLVPHCDVAENRTLMGLVRAYDQADACAICPSKLGSRRPAIAGREDGRALVSVSRKSAVQEPAE